jgi:hypothetical protein
MSLPDAEAGPPAVSIGRRVAIGCFTAWLGLVSGAMVAVLLSKFVAYLTRAPACDGIPSCNWYIYAMMGGGIGALSLPLLVLRVLGRPAKLRKRANPDRGL